MNLKDLKYLVALADTGHFGKAAERSFVSQPTLSAQLKKLEEYLGVKLVERQPKNVQLTEIGRQVVQRARRMLEQSDEIVALARNNADPLSGRIRVALIPTVGPYLLPRVTQKIRKALPNLGLMLYEYQTEPLLRRLREGEFDLGIIALPTAPEGLETRILYEEDFMLAVPTTACSHRQNIHKNSGSERPGAIAAGGRALPARPGAGGLQPRGRAGSGGFSRHEPRDLEADGGRRARHHAAAGAGGRIAVRRTTRPGDAAVRKARAIAHHRRGVAQIQYARCWPSRLCATCSRASCPNGHDPQLKGSAPRRAPLRRGSRRGVPCERRRGARRTRPRPALARFAPVLRRRRLRRTGHARRGQPAPAKKPAARACSSCRARRDRAWESMPAPYGSIPVTSPRAACNTSPCRRRAPSGRWARCCSRMRGLS